ncbi:NADH-ubiquinone oxidoreductase chain H (EC 1.6.5.3) [uncultured Gammaproteobacteria bacterium]|jgi:NADH-quinone oxidoreductase subunit H|uniref:NADH-quinone oxidoreductase subunit H n=3 Tax=sulfur-oxidizing symbionts TaxID=32036 RepID=A0A1H6KDS8_9GAMM|nr:MULTISPECIES: NADH-quinone oxidoreductase subunit NuoH [sulfur-oxidizing symbionts]CAC9493617.1 NADH-ubiquinone oxidoreductase chain H (EC 1.6.5.3) [uncultured Gammaproteobacteria bacterium]CAB5506161.1 NADH-ubiquinone oxidoreductase chain H (EC [Bathymodiolus azoricus thioautotrophic gill symbiont]CAB5508051.1 NADH-ubiquinone oxidoreductase chain H (EC [Bathymodiolus thermophilus thioautotrophic gill symbiont]CAC9510357.1 NADH-ubiquinone oxidoreductase chain H (EC 1.6.5.3) [uncultured Gamma
MTEFWQWIYELFPWFDGVFASIVIILIKAMALVAPLMLVVAYFTYAERKVIGYMQLRIGPNRVGPKGWLQPIADAFKLMTKEIIFPSKANIYLFLLAPVLAIAPAIAIWAVVPFDEGMYVANLDISLLYVLAIGSVGVYGIILAGWASNSKYPLLGALRSASLLVSYEIVIGFALVTVVMIAGSVNLNDIVMAQKGGVLNWYFIPLFPMMIIFFISALVETNRAPFDVVEGESEIVGGTHVEYSGMTFAVFFLAEYANMIFMAVLAVILFFGGWHSPFGGIAYLGAGFSWVPGIIWLLAKSTFFMFLYLWIRATFPRFRYDQIMRLSWKVFLPWTIVWIFVVALMTQFKIGPWF